MLLQSTGVMMCLLYMSICSIGLMKNKSMERNISIQQIDILFKRLIHCLYHCLMAFGSNYNPKTNPNLSFKPTCFSTMTSIPIVTTSQKMTVSPITRSSIRVFPKQVFGYLESLHPRVCAEAAITASSADRNYNQYSSITHTKT